MPRCGALVGRGARKDSRVVVLTAGYLHSDWESMGVEAARQADRGETCVAEGFGHPVKAPLRVGDLEAVGVGRAAGVTGGGT
jgi:hypothetical protein